MESTARASNGSAPMGRFTVLGSAANEANSELVHELRSRGVDAALVAASEGLRSLRAGDWALGRLDVLPGLDGVEPGLLALLQLERRGVYLLNRAAALLTVHDKLRTAQVLEAAGLPHPRTLHLREAGALPTWKTPFVLKPRFGSWGRDVFRCNDRTDGERVMAAVRGRPWFRRHGVLAQELLPTRESDLRLVVARGVVIGAATRSAAPGEWRTNISLGGSLEPADASPAAIALASAAATAVGADLVGVDLFPVDGGYTVLELNGAVEFDARYSIRGCDVYDAVVDVLSLPQGVPVTA